VRALQRSAGNQAVTRFLTSRRNATGIPDAVKNGAEQLSGLSLDDVRVHYGSTLPATLGALAYTEGSDIHVSPGQERHVPHEVWHAVQQKQGRVGRAVTLGGREANIDPALEAEADQMGARAAQAATESPRQPTRSAEASSPVVQPRLGFELEMLALVDINGRPIPEKTVLGTYGAQNLTLTVDHGPAVEAATPTPAVDANFSVPGAGGDSTPHGPFDAPPGTQTRVGFPPPPLPPAPPPARQVDPRTPVLVPALLSTPGWGARSIGIDRRAAGNADIVTIDKAVAQYEPLYEHFLPQRAGRVLATILAAIDRWRTANPRPNSLGKEAWQAAEDATNALSFEAAAHDMMWRAYPAPPPGMVPLFSDGGGWTAEHPTYGPEQGMGTDKYASILEVVTPGGPGFEPELAGGRANIIAAMMEAVALAKRIEAATNNFAARVPLSTVLGVTLRNPATHIGNAGQPNQTTDASIQSTMAIDLAQMATFVSSTVGLNAQTHFTLKHHADQGPEASRAPIATERAKEELALAAGDAGPILTMVGRGAAPSLVNLRGLIVLICQYLRMGRYFIWEGEAGLDKNVVDLLSRTDLATIYRDGVPDPAGSPGTEKAWAQANLAALQLAILTRTGRRAEGPLLTDPTEEAIVDSVPGALTAAEFVQNVFTSASDGLTPNLGGFTRMDMESVDPAGARAGDTRTPGAPQRTGPVFELRNMRPVGAADRYPRNRWVGLATYMTNLLQGVNARTEADAVRDARYIEATGAMNPALADW
jgi:hypothetical protein